MYGASLIVVNEPVSTPTPGPTASDENRRISLAVVRAVADAKGTSPFEIQPLGSVIDTDALDSLVDSVVGSPRSDASAVRFDYEGYRVAVDADGTVEVSERTD